MSVQAGVRCLSVLALLSGAALSDVGVASYPRWSDTRFPGAIVFSEQVGSVLQCGSVCGTFGDACVVFTVQKVDDGVRCDIVQGATSPEAAAGFHSYTSSRYVGASDKKPRYFFARSSVVWEDSPAACTQMNSSAALFRPETKDEFMLVQELLDKRDVSGKFWIDITHSNYPADSFEIEGNHERNDNKRCAYMEKNKDHIHYEECDDDIDGSVCSVNA